MEQLRLSIRIDMSSSWEGDTQAFGEYLIAKIQGHCNSPAPSPKGTITKRLVKVHTNSES